MSNFLHAIIGGHPFDLPGLPGLGPKDKGLTILFPLSMGGTVNDLANALHVPVESILAVNPGLTADSSLGVRQVVDLPEGHLDQIMRSVSVDGNHAYVSAPSPSPSSVPPPDVSSPSSVSSESYTVQVSIDNVSVRVNVDLTTLRSTTIALDLFNDPQQNVLFPLPIEKGADRWIASINPDDFMIGAGDSLNASNIVAPVSQLSSTATSNLTPLSTSVPAGDPQATTVLVVSNIDADKIIGASSMQFQGEREGAFSYTRVVTVVVPATQDRQRGPGSDMPPPPPIDVNRFAGPFMKAVSNNGITIVPPAVMNAMDLPTGNHPMTLQLMALLMAQSSGVAAAGMGAPVPSQPSSYVDPQALAALAASMRGTKVVDLGAGRRMEFSLVNDRMRRVDPIRQEDRPAFRRTGDGLEEVRVSSPHGEDVEQTDEQREQGRRRRAAIAAMRRRRRARSRRCRYWRGARRDLRASGDVHYPKRVDLAEFRSRQPPRYMWNVSGES